MSDDYVDLMDEDTTAAAWAQVEQEERRSIEEFLDRSWWISENQDEQFITAASAAHEQR